MLLLYLLSSLFSTFPFFASAVVIVGSNKVIGVDIEHSAEMSYRGTTCLIQISTDQTNYIVDTLALYNKIPRLNEIFLDSDIVKAFHNADSDIIWLQVNALR